MKITIGQLRKLLRESIGKNSLGLAKEALRQTLYADIEGSRETFLVMLDALEDEGNVALANDMRDADRFQRIAILYKLSDEYNFGYDRELTQVTWEDVAKDNDRAKSFESTFTSNRTLNFNLYPRDLSDVLFYGNADEYARAMFDDDDDVELDDDGEYVNYWPHDLESKMKFFVDATGTYWFTGQDLDEYFYSPVKHSWYYLDEYLPKEARDE